jgi:hypothetical protein
MGEKRNAHRALIVKPEGNRPLRRHKHTCKYIKMVPKDRRWEGII